VPLFGELVRRHPDETGSQTGHVVGEAYCAANEKRHVDGLGYLKRAEDIGRIGSRLDTLGLFFAVELEDGREALARIRSLAAS
jgi:hypothetical protein